ncbi:hypothetical protein BB560_003152 [Smittium megazygosporum]|uniref:Uncharacterized protein n=1 Tax=Smittium megazygosporum TaxID=133381 RepID=A0A2T9ZCT0_9FUNG|nr:hypothetical protein BB560_003152 [Smittium megazygosporum]
MYSLNTTTFDKNDSSGSLGNFKSVFDKLNTEKSSEPSELPPSKPSNLSDSKKTPGSKPGSVVSDKKDSESHISPEPRQTSPKSNSKLESRAFPAAIYEKHIAKHSLFLNGFSAKNRSASMTPLASESPTSSRSNSQASRKYEKESDPISPKPRFGSIAKSFSKLSLSEASSPEPSSPETQTQHTETHPSNKYKRGSNVVVKLNPEIFSKVQRPHPTEAESASQKHLFQRKLAPKLFTNKKSSSQLKKTESIKDSTSHEPIARSPTKNVYQRSKSYYSTEPNDSQQPIVEKNFFTQNSFSKRVHLSNGIYSSKSIYKFLESEHAAKSLVADNSQVTEDDLNKLDSSSKYSKELYSISNIGIDSKLPPIDIPHSSFDLSIPITATSGDTARNSNATLSDRTSNTPKPSPKSKQIFSNQQAPSPAKTDQSSPKIVSSSGKNLQPQPPTSPTISNQLPGFQKFGFMFNDVN